MLTEVDTRPALSAVAQGHPIVVAGPRGCDLVVLAARATTASTAFLIRHGSGFITVAMTADRLAALEVPAQRVPGCGPPGPALHVAVDAAVGISTGISAHDRALTIRLLAEPLSTPASFIRPGHVLPVRADLDSNMPPGPVETAAMVGLVATESPVVAMCSLVSESDPTCIAQATEGERFAGEQGIAFLPSWEITKMFYRHCAMRDMYV